MRVRMLWLVLKRKKPYWLFMETVLPVRVLPLFSLRLIPVLLFEAVLSVRVLSLLFEIPIPLTPFDEVVLPVSVLLLLWESI